MKLLYKGTITAIAALVLLTGSFTGCEAGGLANGLGEQLGDSVKEAVADAASQVSEDIKGAVVNEVKEYITSDEMSETLGLTPEEQESVLNCVREYIDNYEFDAKQIKEAKESVEELLQNADGLSADELKEQIAQLLEQDK